MADERIRELERAAAAGDEASKQLLRAARERAGRCPDCGGDHAKPVTDSCRERGFLRVLRELKSATTQKEIDHARWEVETAIEASLVTERQRAELEQAMREAVVWVQSWESLSEPATVTPPAVIQAARDSHMLMRWPKRADPHAEGTRARSCRACKAAVDEAAHTIARATGGALSTLSTWRRQARAAINMALAADPCVVRAPKTVTAAKPWWAVKNASSWPEQQWQRERKEALVRIGAPGYAAPGPATNHDAGPLFNSRGQNRCEMSDPDGIPPPASGGRPSNEERGA